MILPVVKITGEFCEILELIDIFGNLTVCLGGGPPPPP